jgi:hypothetical protein
MDFKTWKTIRGPLDDFVKVREISTCEELLACIQGLQFNDPRWAFRGQSDSNWGLKTTIERCATRPGIAEEWVIGEFKRRAHHYVRDVPHDEDTLEWLALMQHYGAPTRLLDWTKSPYVAAFFAAESGNSELPFAIWAIDQKSVSAEVRTMLGLIDEADLSSRENFRKVFVDQQPEDLYVVAPVQPQRMNARLTIQQGMFLYANHQLLGFETCLKNVLHHASQRGTDRGDWLHKLVIAPAERLNVLKALNRMNLNFATLFPGLDGFARSLRTSTEIRDHDQNEK